MTDIESNPGQDPGEFPVVSDQIFPNTDSEDPNSRLQALVTEIKRYQEEASDQAKENLATRRTIGRALNEAKSLVKKTKFPGGWREWCKGQEWGTRWADQLIRVHVTWQDLQAAVAWKKDAEGEAPDGVRAALKALSEFKRRDETTDEAQRRKLAKGGYGDKKARHKVVARVVAEIRRTGKVPEAWPVEVSEFVKETLKGSDDESESLGSHSEEDVSEGDVSFADAPRFAEVSAEEPEHDASVQDPPEVGGVGAEDETPDSAIEVEHRSPVLRLVEAGPVCDKTDSRTDVEAYPVDDDLRDYMEATLVELLTPQMGAAEAKRVVRRDNPKRKPKPKT